ncbi:hypothetical protein OQA88_7070 [Cercophora sp. LCS_1]
MSFPASFLPLVKSTRFWTDYFFLTDTANPSPYKPAFQDAEDDSDDDFQDQNSDEEADSDQDPNDQHEDNLDISSSGSDNRDPHNNDSEEDADSLSPESQESHTPQPQSEPDEEDNHPDSQEQRDSSSSSSSSSSSFSRPRSPIYSQTFRFPISANFALTISICPTFSYIPLSFSTPSIRNRDIAHDDQAHWHPHVLRWSELELICRAVSTTSSDESYKHPGLPLLFLCRFAPICVGDDVQHIVAMLARAWIRILGEGARDGDIRRLIERGDFRKQKYAWFEDDGYRWIGQGESKASAEGVYTYRYREAVQEGKWLNTEWNQLLEEVERIVKTGDVGEDRMDDEELFARYAPRTRHGLNVWLALTEKDRPMHQRAGRYFCLTLDGILRVLDLGKAGPSGASSCTIDGRWVYTSDHSSVTVWGDLARGRAVIKQMLWWLRAPLATTLRDASSYEELPFSLADDAEDCIGEVYLGICVPDILSSCSWLVSHTLPDSLGATIESKEVLGSGGRLSGPTEDNWRTLRTADGGDLGFNLSRFDGEAIEGTGTIFLRRITPEASAALHRLMEISGAVLTPIALAAKPLQDEIASKWVGHRVVDAENLHEILVAGSYDLWVKAERNVGGRVGESGTGYDSDEEAVTNSEW